MNRRAEKIIVIGHKNPDTDSIAASYALAELKRALGVPNVIAGCAGLPRARTEYLFERFKAPMPTVFNDLYLCVKDIVDPDIPRLNSADSLYHALELLGELHLPRLPIVDAEGKYCGMLCLYSLIGELLTTNQGDQSATLTGRVVRSSLTLIAHVLQGELLSAKHEEVEQNFEVYVAAMNTDSFKEHIPRKNPGSLVIVVGDRADVHLMAINANARLMIVTGSRKVDPVIIQAAKDRGVSIIKTSLDSATVIRRLKFSCPVESAMRDVTPFTTENRLRDIRGQLLREHDDLFPVVDSQGNLLGAFRKQDLENNELVKLILVDHNEFDQAVLGVEELPIIEVVDHHRLGMPPTTNPIKITCDIVGSSCTLICEMFRAYGIEPTSECAAIMLGGVVTDTLMLRSPTSTPRDKVAIEYLQKLSGVDPEALLDDIFKEGSLIARSTPEQIIGADYKVFHDNDIDFAIAQVEEVGFEEFYEQEESILAALKVELEQKQLKFLALMVTNVVKETSLLLAVGDKELLNRLPYRKERTNLWLMPGVLSRKKQLLPQILTLTSL